MFRFISRYGKGITNDIALKYYLNNSITLVYAFSFSTLDSFLIEVRTFQEHHYISKYLSQHEKNTIWWIGATDSSPMAPKEGSFVWLTDQLEIKPFTGNNNLENQTINFQASKDNTVSLWGPGQPDNWPNQVRSLHYASGLECLVI